MGLCSNTECERFTIGDHRKGWRICADDEFCMSHHSILISILDDGTAVERMNARWGEAICSCNEASTVATVDRRINDLEREVDDLRGVIRYLQDTLASLSQTAQAT